MLAALQRKGKSMTNGSTSGKKEKSKKSITHNNSTTHSVKFQSDYPTEIWEKSRSPSPNNMRGHVSKEATARSKGVSYSYSSSSESDSSSSLDEIAFFDQKRRKNSKKCCKGDVISSSSSDLSSDCSSLDWPIDHKSKSKSQKNGQQPQLRYPPTIHVPDEQPHIVCVTANYLPSQEWQSQYHVMPVAFGEYVYVDKQPPRTEDDINRGAASWILVRKVGTNLILGRSGFIPRHLTRIANPQEVMSLVQQNKTTMMHRSTNGGFDQQFQSPHINRHEMTHFEPTWAKKLGTNLPYNPNYDLNSLHQSNRTSSGIYGSEHEDKDSGRGPSSGSEWSASKYGSFGGLDEHDLENEGSEINLNRSDEADSGIGSKYSTSTCISQNAGSKDESSSSSHSPPSLSLPPPMKPLTSDITPKLIEKLNCVCIGDKLEFATPLILRNRTQNNEYLASSSSHNNLINGQKSPPWEPYRTITQKEENKVETFTRV